MKVSFRDFKDDWISWFAIIICLLIFGSFTIIGGYWTYDTIVVMQKDLITTSAEITDVKEQTCRTSSKGRIPGGRDYKCYDLTVSYIDQHDVSHSFIETKTLNVPGNGYLPIVYDRNDPTFARSVDRLEDSKAVSPYVFGIGILVTYFMIRIIMVRMEAMYGKKIKD